MKFLYEFEQRNSRRVILDAENREEAERFLTSMFSNGSLNFDDTNIPHKPMETDVEVSVDGEPPSVKQVRYEYQNSAVSQFDCFLLRSSSDV